ncbi:MAG: hypothetical protein ABI640_06900 [Gammaproteobacteria bacterium]
MSAMAQEVRPAGSRLEWLGMIAATIAVVGALGFYVVAHSDEHSTEPIYDWQVSAFAGLTGPDQAIYNSLHTVKDEIPFIYDDINQFNEPGQKFHWPNLTDFQDWLLPPFYKDTSWEQQGSLTWTLFEPLPEGEMQGTTMYLGTDGKLPGQGSFLLTIGHVHAGFTNTNAMVIWWISKNHMEMPQSGFRDGLILKGWREVVPYSGAAEVKRLFGADAAERAKAQFKGFPPDGTVPDASTSSDGGSTDNASGDSASADAAATKAAEVEQLIQNALGGQDTEKGK